MVVRSPKSHTYFKVNLLLGVNIIPVKSHYPGGECALLKVCSLKVSSAALGAVDTEHTGHTEGQCAAPAPG